MRSKPCAASMAFGRNRMEFVCVCFFFFFFCFLFAGVGGCVGILKIIPHIYTVPFQLGAGF